MPLDSKTPSKILPGSWSGLPCPLQTWRKPCQDNPTSVSPASGLATESPTAHLALDIRSNAEEQGPVEGELNHVVPVLGGQHALKDKGTGCRGSSLYSRGFIFPSTGISQHTWLPEVLCAMPGVQCPSVGIRQTHMGARDSPTTWAP